MKAEVFAKPAGRILPGGRRMERITAGDDVSSLEITWFNNPYATQKLELGQEYYFEGHRDRRDASPSDGQPAGAHSGTDHRRSLRGRLPPDRGAFQHRDRKMHPAAAPPCGTPARPAARGDAEKNTACSPRPMLCGPSTALPQRRRLLQPGGGSSTRSCWCSSWALDG